ncbi:MAG: vanw family protein [Sphingomonas sp.]|uniref:VanW family protein n=1 Tax=Sphingomonas sp. TaxID=28214 RepID=UPI0012040A3B|nr:VanW family protein [Sphingomonas sp.]THD37756.1 MAG: vanw family protein [Sphingomonas sp.]
MSDRLANVAMPPDRAVPTRLGNWVFEGKATLLRLRRSGRELADPVKRHRAGQALADAPVLARVTSPLWTSQGGAKDRALNAGKIQNLRAAIAGLDGIEVGVGEVLSFWRQVGKPLKRRGFVEGRELREGCMIATVGGGLCQLSNALYEAAVDAGLEVVERHAHTRIVPGSRAAAGRDATVFWNYLDFRVRSRHAFRIDATLSADALDVTVRGFGEGAIAPTPAFLTGSAAHDCLSCGQVSCHRHNPDTEPVDAPTAWLVDAATPEFAALYRACADEADLLMLPSRRFGRQASGWPTVAPERTTDIAVLQRSLALRTAAKGTPRAALLLAADARLAKAYARRLSAQYTHLVIAQPLLPHLWRLGALRGRSFEVLLDRLPIDALHDLLDTAAERHPDSPTLGDFRAPASVAQAEREALGAATRLITPHRAVAACFPRDRVEVIDWLPAPALAAQRDGKTFLFAGPALARKGVHAMRAAIAGLDARLAIERPGEDQPGFWGDLDVQLQTDAPDQLAGVILPALVEHNPRTLLRALAAGLPVIATPACGLPAQPGLTLIPANDPAALRDAMQHALDSAPA